MGRRSPGRAALNEGRRVALVKSYVRRSDLIDRSLVQFALSNELPEITGRATREGIASLSDVDRSRIFYWEMAPSHRVDSQFYQWQQGLLEDDYYEDQFKLCGIAMERARHPTDQGEFSG